jgi:hypothetical protein
VKQARDLPVADPANATFLQTVQTRDTKTRRKVNSLWPPLPAG